MTSSPITHLQRKKQDVSDIDQAFLPRLGQKYTIAPI
jgi:hypothetical protein